jgi:hypothetical protein
MHGSSSSWKARATTPPQPRALLPDCHDNSQAPFLLPHFSVRPVAIARFLNLTSSPRDLARSITLARRRQYGRRLQTRRETFPFSVRHSCMRSLAHYVLYRPLAAPL